MQTHLAAQATLISRRIFASLPWGFRLAHLLTKIAVNTQEAFGRFVFAEFLKAGVEGLPDIDGQPALSLRAKIQGPKAADKLPRGYGRAFGTKVWMVALSKYRDPEIVEDAISRVMVKLVTGDAKVREGSHIKVAESFIITAVINAATDVLRKKKWETPSLVRRDEESGAYTEIDITDPGAFHELEQALPRSEMVKIMRDLKQVHDRAPAWVEAQLDGLSNLEIAAEWGISPAAASQWAKRYIPEIEAVFQKYLRAAA
jgi:RNA polymerase sigma factor (sigma-70 family)